MPDVRQDESHRPPCDPMLLSGVIASEFDLEIGLRERLAQTLDARIAWAELLKESLENDSQIRSAAPESFKYTAFDALKVSEKPSKILREQEVPVPPDIWLKEASRTARTAPKPKNHFPRNSKSSFLYIRSSSLVISTAGEESKSEFYSLKCPVCSRTTFTSLQGLLNHARISHSLEWGTHEECVQACAVADPAIDTEAGIEVGVGFSGILPGLRTIFQMAVGPSYISGVSGRAQLSFEGGRPDEDGVETIPNLLTKTLGLHEGTRALARFLGKEPVRRGIRACHQDEILDVDTLDQNGSLGSVKSRSNWRLRFAQRGSAFQIVPDAGQEITYIVNEDVFPASGRDGTESGTPKEGNRISVLSSAAATRFHFATRITITDRSLWMDADRSDSGTQFSHRWMLTVDAPSYACDIATVLKYMKVTPLSAPDLVRCYHSIVDKPPYVVVGMASRPFLAAIELVFNEIEGNGGEGQPFSLEHWVDLDPLKSLAAVTGDEQIYDIELDKKTVIKPISLNNPPISHKALWQLADELHPDEGSKCGPDQQANSTCHLGYQAVLSRLLSQFPLTLKDTRRKRGSKSVPYRLVSSEAHFTNLVEGRRKAIEWGRSRALRDAYNEVVQGQHPHLPPLTTAGVHAWLREEGYIVPLEGSVKEMQRPDNNQHKPMHQGDGPSRWCILCGLEPAPHLLMKTVETESSPQRSSPEPGESMIMDMNCQIALTEKIPFPSRLPPVNVNRPKLLSSAFSKVGDAVKTYAASAFLAPRNILSVSDPHVTLAIYHSVRQLRLSHFGGDTVSSSPYPLDRFGQTPEEVEAILAPYGLLTVCLRPFIGKIISSGLGVAMQQKMFASAPSILRKSSRKKEPREDAPQISLLTPAHILTGIRSCGTQARASAGEVDKTILLCLSSLGTTFTPQDPADSYTNPEEGS